MNYDKYFSVGSHDITIGEEYNSSNTQILNLEQIKEKLLVVNYVRSNWRNGSTDENTGDWRQSSLAETWPAELRNRGFSDIYEYDVDTVEPLDHFTSDCEFVYHLAGVNRPENQDDYMKGNTGFTIDLLYSLKINNNRAPILMTSSIRAEETIHMAKAKGCRRYAV